MAFEHGGIYKAAGGAGQLKSYRVVFAPDSDSAVSLNAAFRADPGVAEIAERIRAGRRARRAGQQRQGRPQDA